jgi:hypothetical protein
MHVQFEIESLMTMENSEFQVRNICYFILSSMNQETVESSQTSRFR